ncbi:MAG: molybdopterin-dependent oxidoreductase [Dehalococcoidia bacterium]|nr:molybdopterin-dependent oxidoreductase [Dehalococcoidia bacterium]
MHELTTLERLPVFWAPDRPRDIDAWTIQVEGLVSSPAQLPVGAVRAMPAEELTVDFRCEEGWEVPELRWIRRSACEPALGRAAPSIREVRRCCRRRLRHLARTGPA